MRCNPWRWLWGAVPLLILACVAVVSDQPRVESDLAQRAKAALDKASMSWATVSFSGREATIAGRASDENEPYKAFDVVRNVWGVGTIDNRAQLVERVDRYVWTATRFDDRVRFNGFVPTADVRRDIIGMATPMFANLKIEHEPLKIARGSPPIDQWMAGISFALKQLADLKSGGQVDLDGTSLSISGEALSPKTYETVQTALKRLPPSLRIKTANIRAPAIKPYVWSAKLDRGGLELMGHAPSVASRDSLKAAAEKIDGKARVNMDVAAGNDPGFEALAAVAVRELGKLETGEARLRDKQLVFTGMAAKEETADAVRAALKQAVPASFKLEEKIEFREATVRPVTPYVTRIEISAASVRASGYAPSDAEKVTIAESLKQQLPGHNVVNELQIGAGQPPGWKPCIDAGIAALARLGNGNILLSDRRLSLNGATTVDEMSETLPRELRAKAAGNCDTFTNIAVSAPPEPRLTWRARLDDGFVALTGDVPDEATKAGLLQSAQTLFAGIRVVDEMRVAGGSGGRWRRVAEDALKILARLRIGEARVEGDQLAISGEARDGTAQAEIRELLSHLPKGYGGREAIEVRADAAAVEAEARKQVEAQLRRKAEEEARQRTAALAEEARRKSEAESEARVRAEAAARADAEARRRAEDEARQRAAAAAAEDARRKSEAESEARVKAAAEARRKAEDDARRRAADIAAAEAAKRKNETEVRAKAETEARARTEANVCQDLLKSAASQGIIRFQRASAVIDRASYPTLDALVRIVAQCPQALIQVEGHTDSDGTIERNQLLSERRAASVAEYLVKAGVTQTRLTAVGVGQMRPVAPNDTDDGKSRNRRIEFVVRTQ